MVDGVEGGVEEVVFIETWNTTTLDTVAFCPLLFTKKQSQRVDHDCVVLRRGLDLVLPGLHQVGTYTVI